MPTIALDSSPTEHLRLFRQGFLLMLPLWAGAIPSGLAYGIAAGQVGLSPLDTQLMSLLVFSSAGQISAVALIGEGTSTWLLVGTVLAVNIQLLLIGVTIRRQVRASRGALLVTGWFLTDAAYALTAAAGTVRLAVLTGAGACMYFGWNIGTALGIMTGNAIPDPERLGLDLVIPLAFLAVLAPQLRSRPAVLVVAVSAMVALVAGAMAPGGVAVLAAGVIGGATGAVAIQRRNTP
jgi:predicted branched-subunit amino acid permease